MFMQDDQKESKRLFRIMPANSIFPTKFQKKKKLKKVQ